VFLCRDKDTTPLALRADVEHTHTLPEKVVIVSVDTVSIPHVETFDRCAVEVLGHGRFKIAHLTARFGYHDNLSIPEALAQARKQGLLERSLDLEHASYFVSRIAIIPTDSPSLQRWRKNLFVAMARNASSAIEHFGLPSDRTVILGSQVPL
jgi:KUP system potassium uptake protein